MMTTPNRSRWLVAFSVSLAGLVVAIAIAAALAPSLLPTGDQMGGEGRSVAAGVIFVGSYTPTHRRLGRNSLCFSVWRILLGA
jgi:uncharacterized membrane protein